jgi:hypothetical protein
LATHLLVRLAAICPSDPFDGFWAWMGCSVLKAFGANPDTLRGDLVFQLLSNPSSPSASGCPSMLESFLGPRQSCLTEQLWQLMEPAGYVLIVAVLGARFGKMVASNNFSVSPGWAVADPVLRSVVAGTFVHLSYGLMVLGHSGMETVSILLFGKITAAGGVTGIWLLDPAGAAVAASPSGGGALLVDIIHWLFSLYILVMVLASLVGFQVCVVLAPLVIPLWIFSGQNQVFSWFTKTVIGATILPVVVGVGWAVFLDLIHQFSVTQNPSVITIFAGWVLELVFVIAGVWFMTRFIKATTGEVFASQNLLSTVFMAEATLMMTNRMAWGAMGHQTALRAAAGVLNHGARHYVPHAMMAHAQGLLSSDAGTQTVVEQVVSSQTPARNAAADAASRLEPRLFPRMADQRVSNAEAALRAGHPDEAAEWIAPLVAVPSPIAGGPDSYPLSHKLVNDALGRGTHGTRTGMEAAALAARLEHGYGTEPWPANIQAGGNYLDSVAAARQAEVTSLQQRIETLHQSRHRGTP